MCVIEDIPRWELVSRGLAPAVPVLVPCKPHRRKPTRFLITAVALLRLFAFLDPAAPRDEIGRAMARCQRPYPHLDPASGGTAPLTKAASTSPQLQAGARVERLFKASAAGFSQSTTPQRRLRCITARCDVFLSVFLRRVLTGCL